MLALVTAACFVTLVAVGVGYVVHSDPDEAALVRTEPESTPASPTQTSAVPTPAVLPAPGRAVTLTAKPSPTKKPKPKPEARRPSPPRPRSRRRCWTSRSAPSTCSAAATRPVRGKRPGMASGRVRAGRAAALVRRHGSEVVGFQELQRDQLAVMSREHVDGLLPGIRGPRPGLGELHRLAARRLRRGREAHREHPLLQRPPARDALRQAAQPQHRARGLVRQLPQPGRHPAVPPPAALAGPRHRGRDRGSPTG